MPVDKTGDPRKDELLVGLEDIRDLLTPSLDLPDEHTRRRVRDARDTLAAASRYIREEDS